MAKVLDHGKNCLDELREIKDGITEVVDNLGMCCTASEVILGYLSIDGKQTQITLKAETDEDEWISD